MATIAFENVSKQFEDGTVAVDGLELMVEEGEFLILVGPSGCGKTTALRMVAGLEDVTEGAIRIAGRDVTHLPPVDRDIAMVFQNYALYPHMSVEDNILFPLRQKGVKKAEARERAHEVARLLSIEELLHRKPRALSGGQRQRVAIGRALVRRPVAFLMDEPLSNLDAKLRVQMRAELLTLHRQVGITTVYVTHDQTEAMTLGDRVVVMNKGVVQQVATPDELYRRPANTFVAGFIGSPSMNFIRGAVDDGALVIGSRSFPLSPGQRDRLGGRGGELIVGVRPESFVAANGHGGFAGRVQFVESLGPESLVHFTADELEPVDDEPALLIARFGADAAYAADAPTELSIDVERVSLFDPDDGRAIA
ncbi:MAG TPA: sn-glycerol-3-phosphate ABC transporter ATP-binding protein UgpC [Gaiellaceae bacterium]|nr:sn-glycerol-3-phosphate ABC transporter ATP-binding protein UgpC [Gaiellaceae bacterium]